MSDYERTIEDNVREHGWFCVAVVDPEGNDPAFAYSVGFNETLGTPEVIVFGLDHELMHAMLWTAFRQVREGRALHDGDRWGGLLDGFDCILKTVDPTNIVPEYFNSAIWYHGDPATHGLLEASQIVWPDADTGRFPWDPGCPPLVRELQPALYPPASRRH